MRVDRPPSVCTTRRDGNRAEWLVAGDVARRAPTATDRNEPIPGVFLPSWEYTPIRLPPRRLLRVVCGPRPCPRPSPSPSRKGCRGVGSLRPSGPRDFPKFLPPLGANPRGKVSLLGFNWVAASATKIVKVTSTVSRRTIFRLGGSATRRIVSRDNIRAVLPRAAIKRVVQGLRETGGGYERIGEKYLERDS